MKMNSLQMKSIITMSQKALNDRHPYDLSQQYVDKEVSNKWLTNVDLFAKQRAF